MNKYVQKGITIIEVIGALAISSLMLVGLNTMINTSLEDSKGQQAAQYQSQVVAAVTKYINNPTNFYKIISEGVPTTIDFKLLKNVHLLPPTFSDTNVYGQTTCAIVKLRGAIAPDNQKLDVLVVTTNGEPIPSGVIPAVAANAGPGNGYIKATKGIGASWFLDDLSGFNGTSCAIPGDGHLVSALFFDGPGQLSTDFLYRDKLPGTGREKLNTMNTPLLLANAAVVTEGDDCKIAGTATAGIAVNANFDLLRCDRITGLWRSVTDWRNSVPNYADLPMTGNVDGEVRMIRSPYYRAFAWNASASIWVPLASDQNNDFTARDISATRNINAANDINASNNINAANDINAVHGVSSEYVGTGAIVIRHNYSPGSICNEPRTDANGRTYIINPTGTFVRDLGERWLVCSTGNVFLYQNGTTTPP